MSKNSRASGLPVWQLPVKQSMFTCTDWIHPRAKFHCFVRGDSLCGKYHQDTDWYETDIEESEITKNPQNACRVCLKCWNERRSDE